MGLRFLRELEQGKTTLRLKKISSPLHTRNIPEVTVNRLIKKYNSGTEKVIHLIDHSYFSQEFKDNY